MRLAFCASLGAAATFRTGTLEREASLFLSAQSAAGAKAGSGSWREAALPRDCLRSRALNREF